jgi:hypothetical protein
LIAEVLFNKTPDTLLHAFQLIYFNHIKAVNKYGHDIYKKKTGNFACGGIGGLRSGNSLTPTAKNTTARRVEN